ncbi:MAG: hypothetical protein ACRD4K_02220, partial [Candidatus Acidiferrales bacterium]
RSVVDAASVTPYNVRSVLISLGVFLILTTLATRFGPRRFLLEFMAASLLCAFVVLALLTARSVFQLYGMRMPLAGSWQSVGLAFLLGAGNFTIHWAQGFQTTVMRVVVLELVATTLFLTCAREFRSGWLMHAWRAIFHHANETEAVEISA